MPLLLGDWLMMLMLEQVHFRLLESISPSGWLMEMHTTKFKLCD